MENKISLINNRGRIVWVHSRDLKTHLAQGMRIFPNPKESYYPEYDTQFNAPGDQPPIPSENESSKLAVIRI